MTSILDTNRQIFGLKKVSAPPHTAYDFNFNSFDFGGRSSDETTHSQKFGTFRNIFQTPNQNSGHVFAIRARNHMVG